MRRWARCSPILTAALVGIAGCYPWDKFPTHDDCAESPAEPQCDPRLAQACANHSECGGSLACVAGTCARCSGDAECAPGEQCAAGACRGRCDRPLQELVAATPPQGTLVVPACIYRETVTLDRPLTLTARPGAEIRGSDIWPAERWTPTGQRWTAASAGPDAPEQIFLDGVPLAMVVGTPARGQYALDESRNVVIADDPAGRMLEVTTRKRWIVTASSGVTIRNLTLRHAAGGADDGALSNDGFGDWTLERSALSDAHGSVVLLRGGPRVRVEQNDIGRGGVRGIAGTGGKEWTLVNNIVHDNGGVGPEPRPDGAGGGGGIHFVDVEALTLEKNNRLQRNRGTGVRCERCTNVAILGNRVESSTGAGVLLSGGQGARVIDDVFVDNGWGPPDPTWGWGGGLVLLNMQRVEIAKNVAAWNADGVAVLSQSARAVTEVNVHENVILAEDYSLSSNNDDFAMIWGQDQAATPSMFEPAANNRGDANAFWFGAPPAKRFRFAWDTQRTASLEAFAATAGGRSSSYLTAAQRDDVIEAHGLPPAPRPHP